MNNYLTGVNNTKTAVDLVRQVLRWGDQGITKPFVDDAEELLKNEDKFFVVAEYIESRHGLECVDARVQSGTKTEKLEMIVSGPYDKEKDAVDAKRKFLEE